MKKRINSLEKTKAVFWMITGSLFLALVSVEVKVLSDIPSIEKMFFRSVVGCICIWITFRKKQLTIVKVQKKGLLLLRGVTGFIAAYLNYVAITKISLAEASMLMNLYPFMIILIAYFVLKEKISKYQIAALIFSFLGLLFIIKPGFAEFNLFYVISLGSALFTAIAHISIKILRNTESTETVVLAFCIISSAASFFLMLAEGFVMPNINQWFHLVLLGCFATVYQSCISIAYKFAPAGELSIYGYSTLIFSSMFGIVLWNESFFISTAVGMGCIFIGGITIFYHDNVE